LSVTFTPKSAGTYKVEISGSGFSEASKESFTATDSRTFKVKKPSAFKKVDAELNANRVAENKVELSWAVVGTGAEIYRATTPNGTYKLIKSMKSTQGNSFVDKVKKKQNYFYKLRYYLKSGKKTYYSKFSGSQWKFAEAPGKPTITKAVKKGKKVQLKWKVSKDCGHFTIYHSLKKKSGFEIIDYVAGNEFCYVDKNVKSGQQYYYKVEADIYYDWNGTIKGKKSAVKAVKV
ncbi:MAG: hypothetical protein J5804_04425, partial [Eggerthellaceae bacterium]|nr:hypothetical protein [Eggerthellaceae bacterium]